MSPYEQASALLAKIRAAIHALKLDDGLEKRLTEKAVLFRYQTLQGFLLIMSNEIGRLCQAWLADEIRSNASLTGKNKKSKKRDLTNLNKKDKHEKKKSDRK